MAPLLLATAAAMTLAAEPAVPEPKWSVGFAVSFPRIVQTPTPRLVSGLRVGEVGVPEASGTLPFEPRVEATGERQLQSRLWLEGGAFVHRSADTLELPGTAGGETFYSTAFTAGARAGLRYVATSPEAPVALSLHAALLLSFTSRGIERAEEAPLQPGQTGGLEIESGQATSAGLSAGISVERVVARAIAIRLGVSLVDVALVRAWSRRQSFAGAVTSDTFGLVTGIDLSPSLGVRMVF